jgi:hypothetical protein
MNNATAKIKMLKGSMRCFAFGLFGLLPVIGLPFALAALWISGRIRAQEKQFWNAAKPYRVIGAVSAGVGTIVWVGILIFVVGNVLIPAYLRG